MSATESDSSQISAQYAAAVQAIAEKDLQIAELSKEVKRLQLIVNSIRFGAKSERRRPEEKDDGRQASLLWANGEFQRLRRILTCTRVSNARRLERNAASFSVRAGNYKPHTKVISRDMRLSVSDHPESRKIT